MRIIRPSGRGRLSGTLAVPSPGCSTSIDSSTPMMKFAASDIRKRTGSANLLRPAPRRSAAMEPGPLGIRVKAIHPGASAHEWQERLHAEHRTGEVDRQHAVPFLDLDVGKAYPAGDAALRQGPAEGRPPRPAVRGRRAACIRPRPDPGQRRLRTRDTSSVLAHVHVPPRPKMATARHQPALPPLILTGNTLT